MARLVRVHPVHQPMLMPARVPVLPVKQTKMVCVRQNCIHRVLHIVGTAPPAQRGRVIYAVV